MLQLCNNCQWVSYLPSSGNKRNVNVTFCLVQGLIQYHQKHLKTMIVLQQAFLFEKKNIRP